MVQGEGYSERQRITEELSLVTDPESPNEFSFPSSLKAEVPTSWSRVLCPGILKPPVQLSLIAGRLSTFNFRYPCPIDI